MAPVTNTVVAVGRITNISVSRHAPSKARYTTHAAGHPRPRDTPAWPALLPNMTTFKPNTAAHAPIEIH